MARQNRDMVKVNVYIPRAVYDSSKILAAATGITMSDLIRRGLLQQAIDLRNKTRQATPQAERPD